MNCIFYICADGLSIKKTLDQEGESVSTDTLFYSDFRVWFVLQIMCVYIIYNYLRGNIYWGSSASEVNQVVRIIWVMFPIFLWVMLFQSFQNIPKFLWNILIKATSSSLDRTFKIVKVL